MITIGVFDGVHRGHQALIARTVAAARSRELPSVVLTFDPHPSEVIRPGSHPAQLTTLRRKAELVEELGVDVFCVLPFTPELSRLTAHEFVHEVLVDQLHVAAVIVGENFTFGNKAAGDVALLRTLGRRFGFAAQGAELQGQALGPAETGSAFGADGTDSTATAADTDAGAESEITFSSTYVRSCIDAGDVRAAAEALGRPHRVEGIVVRGAGRGKDLGFPTANLSTPRFAAIPADGVYSCWFTRSTDPGKRLRAAVSVGTNPTFSGRERTVEAYVLDVEEDFYGHDVALDFVVKLRDQIRYDSLDPLVRQMAADVARTRELLTE